MSTRGVRTQCQLGFEVLAPTLDPVEVARALLIANSEAYDRKLAQFLALPEVQMWQRDGATSGQFDCTVLQDLLSVLWPK
jgi:hypothetical protein